MKKRILIISASIAILPILGGISFYQYSQKPKINKASLIIGTLGEIKYQEPLVKYLQQEIRPNNFIDFLLKKPIDIKISGNKDLSYKEAKNLLIKKEWDIAFTLSPMLSVVAKDNQYSFAARLFPNNPPFYQSGIYVRADSSFQSLRDLTPKTTIALGAFNSASSFYMPVYDLYGKILTIDMGSNNLGHRGAVIMKMVKDGQVDVGAGAIGDTVNPKDPEIRIIHQSKNIPSSGVYISPDLSIVDRETLKKLLLNAPKEVQKKSNYGVSEEPDYNTFLQIVRRTEQILSCSDFRKNPVPLFCSTIDAPVKQVSSNNVTGVINGWTLPNEKVIWFTLVSSNKKIYRLEIQQTIINQIPGINSAVEINNRKVQINAEPKKRSDGSLLLSITKPEQLIILD